MNVKDQIRRKDVKTTWKRDELTGGNRPECSQVTWKHGKDKEDE